MGMDSASIAAAATTGPSGLGTPRKSELGKEDFLKLMVTQLTQQDPMNPQDGTEYVAQLAQFTSLERLVNIEKTMENVALAATATNSTLAVGFIGKSVMAAGDTITLGETGGTKIGFDLENDAANVTVEIRDEEGNLVKTFEMSGEKGLNEVKWDGMTDDGNRAFAGSYTVSVKATDSKGNEVGVYTQVQETIKSVSFKGGFPELVMESGRTVSLANVMEVMDGNTDKETDGSE
ncbi:MAG TPA: flagellar hook assembly protein FlgD [Myxococcales bacterium]|nr:flagellar hook assembly protein FlgD [Myxococcales bacterium]